MENKKYVVLVNSFFPGDMAEAFLANELSVTMDEMIEFLIFPFSYARNKKYEKLDCGTVVFLDRFCDSRFWNKVWFCMRAFAEKELWKELFIICRHNISVSKILKCIKFAGNGERHWNCIQREIKRRKIDEKQLVIYSYWMWHHAYAGMKAKKKYRKSKFITRCHRFDLYEYCLSDGYLPFRHAILANLDRIFPVSQSGYDYLRFKYPHLNLENKMKVYYLGTCDYGVTNKLENTVIRIVSCSFLVSVKRVDLIIKAMSDIKYNIEWIHFGDGDQRERLTALAKANMPANVKWKLHGHIDNKELMEFYRKQSITLFLNVSESEGLPVSIMEAISFGIPVLATDVGGTSEIVIEDYNGWLLNKDIEPRELTKKIEEFISLPVEKQMLYRSNARDYWEKFFLATRNYGSFYHDEVICAEKHGK